MNRPARASETARCRTFSLLDRQSCGLDAVPLLEGRGQRDRVLRVERRVDGHGAFTSGAGQDAFLPIRGFEKVERAMRRVGRPALRARDRGRAQQPQHGAMEGAAVRMHAALVAGSHQLAAGSWQPAAGSEPTCDATE